jgi:hypothetical protein
MSEPILIGVGSTAAQMLAVNVLSYTLHRHASRPLEVVPLFRAGIEVPEPKDPKNAPRTPFSFQRFLLPELGGHRRRTIYLDSDMIVFADIGELHDMPMNGADLLSTEPTPERKPVYSVLLLSPDCPWRIGEIVARLDSGETSYEELMFSFRVPGRVEMRLPYRWNSLELYEPGTTSLLHYTDMRHQPWLVRDNPLAGIWVQALLDAIDAGFVSRDDVEDGVARRWVRPSLAYQVEKRIVDPKDLPAWMALRDLPFARYCKRNKYRIF